MTRLMTTFTLMGVLLLGVPMMAQADGYVSPEQLQRSIERQNVQKDRVERIKAYNERFSKKHTKIGVEKVSKKKALVVPELDPNTAGSAAVLLAGGALVVLGRRRRLSAS